MFHWDVNVWQTTLHLTCATAQFPFPEIVAHQASRTNGRCKSHQDAYSSGVAYVLVWASCHFWSISTRSNTIRKSPDKHHSHHLEFVRRFFGFSLSSNEHLQLRPNTAKNTSMDIVVVCIMLSQPCPSKSALKLVLVKIKWSAIRQEFFWSANPEAIDTLFSGPGTICAQTGKT